jgi:hypothetical protein
MGGDLGERMLAAAEADFQPEFAQPRREGGARVGRLFGGKRQARQRQVEQPDLARPQGMAAGAAIQSVGWRLEAFRDCRAQRPNAAFSAGTRSVRSQVKVPFSSSGSRPKWP